MDLTKGSCEVHAWRKEEGRRKEGRKEKNGPLIRRGPIRPALLIGIKWECIETIGTYYGLDQGSYLEEEEEEEEGERRAPNNAGPLRPPLLNGIKWEQIVDIITIRFIQGSSSSYKVHTTTVKKMRALYKKPRLLIGTS